MRDFYGPAVTLAIALLPVLLLKTIPVRGGGEVNGILTLSYLASFIVTVPGLLVAYFWAVIVLVKKLQNRDDQI